MSLINEALKKAARQRAQEASDVPPMPGGSGFRNTGPSRNQTLLIVVGAVALVVVTGVVTGILISGKPAAKPAAVVAAVVTQTPTPVAVQAVQVTAISLPKVEAPVIRVAVPTPTPKAAPVVVAPAAAAPAAAASADGPVDKVQAYIDGLQVAGARAAGSDSKALMDGHVYRLHDTVNRALGLKLVKVDADHLTFVDAAGQTYTKAY